MIYDDAGHAMGVLVMCTSLPRFVVVIILAYCNIFSLLTERVQPIWVLLQHLDVLCHEGRDGNYGLRTCRII